MNLIDIVFGGKDRKIWKWHFDKLSDHFLVFSCIVSMQNCKKKDP